MESATIADPDHRLTAEEAGLWRAMWKELEEVAGAVARLERDFGLPPVPVALQRRGKIEDRRELSSQRPRQLPKRAGPDRTAVCAWENEGGAPPAAPPRESRRPFKAAVEATVMTSDVTAASEARWQVWLAKGRAQDLRTMRKARLVGVGFAIAGAVVLGVALLVR